RRRHTRSDRDWSSDVCSSDLVTQSRTEQANQTELWAAARHIRNVGKLGLPDANDKACRPRVVWDIQRREDGRGGPIKQGAFPLRSEERRVGKECRGGGVRGWC